MRSGNRTDIRPLHAIARMAMRIVVAVVAIVAGVTIASYFALGRPDALFAGGAFPQLVSGAQNLSAPAPGSALATILRVAVICVVVALVLLIGGAGVWDAWQSRQRPSGHARPSDAGSRDGEVRRRSPLDAERGLRPADAEPLWSSERAPTDPDTLQGGTA
jgi:hypothetical protein